MKIVMIDNFWRESYSYPDLLIEENLTKEEALQKVEKFNERINQYSDYIYVVKEDNYILQDYLP